ncbi:MAG: hypothetical protein ACLTYN_10885 [Dysosmobacter welbionis]
MNLIFYAILIYTGFNKVFDQISTGKETFLWAGPNGCLPSCCPSAPSSWCSMRSSIWST